VRAVEVVPEALAAGTGVVGVVVEVAVEPEPPSARLAVVLRFELATNSIRARRRRTNSSGE